MDFSVSYFYAPAMKKLLSHVRVALGLKKRVRVATKYEGDSGKTYFYKTSGGVERKLEVFFPPNHDPAKSKVPGIILFHGGGWQNGDLSQFRYACAYFASRGLVSATAEYQKLGKSEIAKLKKGESMKRVCVIDTKSAIRWFKQHAEELGIDTNRIIAGGGSAGAHTSALATMNPSLSDPAEHEDIDTNVAAYIWFNPAFETKDSADPEIDVLAHMNADLSPAIVFFGDKDKCKRGWDIAHKKWKSLGVKTIDLQLAPGQYHAFFNREPWRALTIIAADEFLINHGLLTGKPTLSMPSSGEKLMHAP